MTDHEASRTLVKSPPELWAECSDAGSLARHLGEFGEIKITRLQPETEVAWEADLASGTVRIEPSAWGTKVTLTAQVEAATAPEPNGIAPPPPPDPEPEPPRLEPLAPPRGFLARLRMRFVLVEPEPMAPAPEPPEPPAPPSAPEAPAPVATDTESALTAALDSLGQAHHRPFSRS